MLCGAQVLCQKQLIFEAIILSQLIFEAIIRSGRGTPAVQDLQQRTFPGCKSHKTYQNYRSPLQLIKFVGNNHFFVCMSKHKLESFSALAITWVGVFSQSSLDNAERIGTVPLLFAYLHVFFGQFRENREIPLVPLTAQTLQITQCTLSHSDKYIVKFWQIPFGEIHFAFCFL